MLSVSWAWMQLLTPTKLVLIYGKMFLINMSKQEKKIQEWANKEVRSHWDNATNDSTQMSRSGLVHTNMHMIELPMASLKRTLRKPLNNCVVRASLLTIRYLRRWWDTILSGNWNWIAPVQHVSSQMKIVLKKVVGAKKGQGLVRNENLKSTPFLRVVLQHCNVLLEEMKLRLKAKRKGKEVATPSYTNDFTAALHEMRVTRERECDIQNRRSRQLMIFRNGTSRQLSLLRWWLEGLHSRRRRSETRSNSKIVWEAIVVYLFSTMFLSM